MLFSQYFLLDFNFSVIHENGFALYRLLVVNDGSSDVQLYSVHSNPLNSNEFCVGGRSQVVRIYDQRKVSAPLHKLCPDHLVCFCIV